MSTMIVAIAIPIIFAVVILAAAYVWRWELDALLRQIERF